MTKRYPFTLIKEQLAARQGKALDFAVGKRTLVLPAAIESWLREHSDLALSPATRVEVDEFTAAAAALLAREYGAEVDAANILPAPGGRAAMSAFVACVLEPGDSVLVTEPGYPAFARLAVHRHARVLDAWLDPEMAFVPDFGVALDGEPVPPRVIALNYPNNPAGVTLTRETIKAIDKVAGARTIVFNDATYGPLVYGHPRNSFLRQGVLENSGLERVELHSFSKLFPLGPVALSFLAGTEETMENVSTYSEFAWSPPSKLQLRATTLCLQDVARMRELREFFPVQLEKLRSVLSDIGFEPYPAPAGVYVLCRAPANIAGKQVNSAAEAAARLMDEFDLAAVPFDSPQCGYLRFSSLYGDDDLDRLSGLRKQILPG
jgi:aspartate/methionine/tyrosine aminotransferase